MFAAPSMNSKHLFLLSLFVLTAFGCAASAQEVTEDRAMRAAADYSRDKRGLSIIVMQGGRILLEEYHNGHTAETPWMLASGTKSFSGVMLAAAVEDGLIRGFDEKVSETITEWKSDRQRNSITLRQLLTLTGGIESGTIGRPPSYSQAVRSAVNALPGEQFEYGPAPFQVFGEVMRRKLAGRKETVMDYLDRRILVPIGLKPARWTMQEGQPNLPSGAFLTAREWLKFGQLLLNGGKWNGKQIIARKLLDELFVGTKANPNYGITFWLNRSNDRSANVADRQARPPGRRAATTEISERGVGENIASDLFMAAGAGNQRLYVVPSMDLVVIRQGRMGDFDDRHFLSLLIQAFKKTSK